MADFTLDYYLPLTKRPVFNLFNIDLEKMMQERNGVIDNLFTLKEKLDIKTEVNQSKTTLLDTLTDIIKEKGIAKIIMSYNEDLNNNEINKLEIKLDVDADNMLYDQGDKII